MSVYWATSILPNRSVLAQPRKYRSGVGGQRFVVRPRVSRVRHEPAAGHTWASLQASSGNYGYQLRWNCNYLVPQDDSQRPDSIVLPLLPGPARPGFCFAWLGSSLAPV